MMMNIRPRVPKPNAYENIYKVFFELIFLYVLYMIVLVLCLACAYIYEVETSSILKEFFDGKALKITIVSILIYAVIILLYKTFHKLDAINWMAYDKSKCENDNVLLLTYKDAMKIVTINLNKWNYAIDCWNGESITYLIRTETYTHDNDVKYTDYYYIFPATILSYIRFTFAMKGIKNRIKTNKDRSKNSAIMENYKKLVSNDIDENYKNRF